MSELVTAEISIHTGLLMLNRPRAINALTYDMVAALTQQLEAWAHDPGVREVVFRGAGERGFCAGADIRELAALVRSGGDWVQHLRHEYALHAAVAAFPKPTSVYMTGVTMGGGLGLAAVCSRRVVDASTRVAMPETKIGWFPDAGMRFFLSRAGAVGMHCALTSAVVGGGDAIAMGIADESSGEALSAPMHEERWIQECYASDDPVEIVRALEQHSDPAARDAGAELRKRSPLGVHVAARAMVLARDMEHADVLEQDVDFAQRMLGIDFVEGVRALVVDKDNEPAWEHPRVEDVPRDLVDSIIGMS